MKFLPLITLALVSLAALPQKANAYVLHSRTANTALTPNTERGEEVIVTWTIVKDGVETLSLYVADNTALESTYIHDMDETYSVPAADRTDDLTNRSWFQAMELGLSYIAARTRLTFVYVDYDDGGKLSAYDTIPGTIGIRADLRVGGLNLNNTDTYLPGGYSAYYNDGGITAVTMNSQYAAFSNLAAIRGVFMHEVGHALGLGHSYVSNSAGNTMMGYDTNGPQIDEIYALQRNYGDIYEGNGDNNSSGTSYDLGILSVGESLDVGTDIAAGSYVQTSGTQNDIASIDDDTDTDYYSFTLLEAQNLDITVDPRGPTSYDYRTVWLSSTIYYSTPLSNSDLSFSIYDSSNTLISSVDSTANGVSEFVNLDLAAGTYYVRINGEVDPSAGDDDFIRTAEAGLAQLYALIVKSTEIPALPVALGHWPMDEAAGTTVTEISGNHYDGSLTKTTNWATGQIEGALTFDVGADKITIPVTPFSGLSDEMTLSFWAYGSADQPVASYPLRAYDAAGEDVIRLSLPNGQGRVIFDTYDNGSLDRVIQPTADVVESEYKGAWNHWVFTKNATTGTMNVYHNGILKLTEIGNNTGSLAGIASVSIGTSYNGLIDDFIMWDEEISADQVLLLYNNNPPEAVAGSYETESDVSVSATLSGTEPDGQTLSYTIDEAPANGTLTGIAPSLIYTPNAGYSGSDSFTYYVNDGVVNSYPVTVDITVNGGGYDSWTPDYADSANEANLADFQADFDGDGIPNGVEYILATDPTDSSSTGLPAVDVTGTHHVITFERNASSVEDTTQILQYGPNLSDWTDLDFTDASSAEVEIGAESNGVETVTVSISNSLVTGSKFFYRIKATRN